MRAKLIIIILIPVLSITILVLLISLTIKKWNQEKQTMINRCYTYDKEANKYGTDIIDCYGFITIHHVDDHYSIKNLRVRSWGPIAIVHNFNQLMVLDDKLYLINQQKNEPALFDNKKVYVFDYMKDNELKHLYLDSKSQIPRYLIFNTQTGNTDFYISFEEMPADARKIFEELKKYDQYAE